MARLIIHLVHGTQFYAWRKPAVPWVEDEPSDACADRDTRSFRAGLRQRLEQKGHEGVEFNVIGWSGRNTHRARQAAADEIRKCLEAREKDAHHFLVAHSHGGSACMLALKPKTGETEWESGLSGVACLATPFLVVREAGWALQATIAWMVLILVGGIMWIMNRMEEGHLLSAGVGILCLVSSWTSILFLMMRYRNREQWTQAPAPAERRVPLLIVRCPGDEASSALGFVAILARILYHVEYLAAWPVRVLQRHPVKLWLVSMGLLMSVAVFAALYPALRGALGSSWKALYLVLLGPLLFGLPLRLLIYGLAYGIDLFGLPLALSVSAEVTPLGPGTTWLVEPPDAEELRAAHSEIYELPRVYDILADWFHERVVAPGGAEVKRAAPPNPSNRTSAGLPA